MNRKYNIKLPPNTLTNADGTPYSAGHDRATDLELIAQAAQNALETGRTWSVEDQLESLRYALEDIIKLCRKDTLSQ